jgi:excisionase family DNA binding protein
MMTIQQVADRLSVSYSVIYRLLRVGELKSHRVGKSARISESQLQAYLGKGRDSKAPGSNGLDLAIRCPKCEVVLVRHRSENLIDDLRSRYSADCRQCKLRILYQVVKFDAWDEAADKLAEFEGPDVLGGDIPPEGAPPADPSEAARGFTVPIDPIDLAIEQAEIDAEQEGDDGEALPAIFEITPNPCPKCTGPPSGSFERKSPVDVVASIYCRTCNPDMKFGPGIQYPMIQAQAATPDEAMNQAVEAWNLAVPLVTAPFQGPEEVPK